MTTPTKALLALLKRFGPSLGGVYLKVARHDLSIAIVLGFGPQPLTVETWKRKFDALWPILSGLQPYIGKFKISQETRDLADELMTQGAKAFGLIDPISTAVVSWVETMIDMHEASAGPGGFAVGVALSGLAPGFAIAGSTAYKRNNWCLSGVPSLDAVMWDVVTAQFLSGSMSIYLDFDQLKAFIIGTA